MTEEVRLHPHARERAILRGASENEIIETVRTGERFAAKFGRSGFRRNFAYNAQWRGRTYATKQIEAIAVQENGWLVLTVIVKFFGEKPP